jgi:pyrimidine-nucleoside phosphorylase
VNIGSASGVTTQALLTSMDSPLGRCAGHSLEVIESIEILKGGGPEDVRDLSVQLAARMVLLGKGAETLNEAEDRVREVLASGRGLEKFRQIIEQQGGNPRVIDDYSLLPSAPAREIVRAGRSGFVHGWHARRVGEAIALLGGGRERVEHGIDHGVGATVHARAGDQVQAGDALLELHYRDPGRLPAALHILKDACPISDAPPASMPLILEVME